MNSYFERAEKVLEKINFSSELSSRDKADLRLAAIKNYAEYGFDYPTFQVNQIIFGEEYTMFTPLNGVRRWSGPDDYQNDLEKMCKKHLEGIDPVKDVVLFNKVDPGEKDPFFTHVHSEVESVYCIQGEIYFHHKNYGNQDFEITHLREGDEITFLPYQPHGANYGADGFFGCFIIRSFIENPKYAIP